MDAYRTATPDSRSRGRHKVATATAWTGLAAVAVTGWLTVGLGQSATVASSGTSGTTSTTDDGSSTSDSTGSSGVTGSGSAPVMTSGGS